jgi:hypothetical protein
MLVTLLTGRTACVALLLQLAPLAAVEPCRIEIIDKSNQWPVPLVELRTTMEGQPCLVGPVPSPGGFSNNLLAPLRDYPVVTTRHPG